tara:strand:+ start:42615 stop:42962 length:348 start_codon:yes stop_codon:yes gene_type:complete
MPSTTTRYGVSHPDKIPLGTTKRVLMPIWGENDQNEMHFVGWFNPTDMSVVDMKASIEYGPPINVPLPDNPTHVEAEYFDVTFDQPGTVDLRCILTDGVTTVDIIQSFQVAEGEE